MTATDISCARHLKRLHSHWVFLLWWYALCQNVIKIYYYCVLNIEQKLKILSNIWSWDTVSEKFTLLTRISNVTFQGFVWHRVECSVSKPRRIKWKHMAWNYATWSKWEYESFCNVAQQQSGIIQLTTWITSLCLLFDACLRMLLSFTWWCVRVGRHTVCGWHWAPAGGPDVLRVQRAYWHWAKECFSLLCGHSRYPWSCRGWTERGCVKGMSAVLFLSSSARISARPQTHEPAKNKQGEQGGSG